MDRAVAGVMREYAGSCVPGPARPRSLPTVCVARPTISDRLAGAPSSAAGDGLRARMDPGATAS